MKSKSTKTALDTVGQRIAEVRRNFLHLSQEKLANQVGVKLRTIQRYESDEHNPPETFYTKLFEINGMINPNWIKTGEGDLLRLTDSLISFSFDYEFVYTQFKEEDYNQKLQIAFAEIKMLRAAILYRDNILKVLINQSVSL